MSLSHQSFSFTQPANHSNSVYSFFSIATDLMTYWWGGNNPAVTAEVQSLTERMQYPEDLVEMPSVDQDAQRQERLARRLIGPEGMEFQVNTYTTSDQFEPAIAVCSGLIKVDTKVKRIM